MTPVQSRMLKECARVRGKLRTKNTRTAYALAEQGLARVTRVFDCDDQGCTIVGVDVELTQKGRRMVG